MRVKMDYTRKEGLPTSEELDVKDVSIDSRDVILDNMDGTTQFVETPEVKSISFLDHEEEDPDKREVLHNYLTQLRKERSRLEQDIHYGMDALNRVDTTIDRALSDLRGISGDPDCVATTDYRLVTSEGEDLMTGDLGLIIDFITLNDYAYSYETSQSDPRGPIFVTTGGGIDLTLVSPNR